jgi:hypothetical protein
MKLVVKKETPSGEPRGKSAQRSGTRSSVPCMPAESEAGNQVTWNLFLFGKPDSSRHGAPLPRDIAFHESLECFLECIADTLQPPQRFIFDLAYRQ